MGSRGAEMEKGSSSVAVSGACGSSDSLNGLKFGKKIYFEDVGGGGGSSSKALQVAAPEPAAAAAAPPAKKGKGVVQGGQQPPRCQVEGCKLDLTGAKAYYCRHKVCGMHSKSPKVVVAGLEQRFCQQCSRFHQLHEFDQGKRSCRRRLAGHNERRRKPPPGPLAPRYGRLSSSFHDDGSRFRSFLMDFSYPSPRPPASGRDVWPTVRTSDRAAIHQWQGGFDGASPVSAAQHGAHSYMQGSNATLYSGPELPPGECLAGVSDSSCALSLLSTQPWGTAASRNRAPMITPSSSFDAGPMTQPVTANNYMANPWGFKGHGAGGSSHEVQHDMGLGHVADGGNGQFSGELELALQGNRPCLDPGPARGYDHSGNVMHWSL